MHIETEGNIRANSSPERKQRDLFGIPHPK